MHDHCRYIFDEKLIHNAKPPSCSDYTHDRSLEVFLAFKKCASHLLIRVYLLFLLYTRPLT